MSQKQGSDWAAGWIAFAGFMMILLGSFHAVAGLVGLIDDQFYVATQKYVFQFDRTTWGWIHLILGIVVVLAGFGVFSGAVWARTVGVILGVVSAIAAFAWLPYYPVWSIAIIAVAIAVIWALTAHGRDVGDNRMNM
jgi:hypothetical protein